MTAMTVVVEIAVDVEVGIVHNNIWPTPASISLENEQTFYIYAFGQCYIVKYSS